MLLDAQKCIPAVKKAMEGAEINYCYVNDFCTGNSDEMEIQAVLKEVRRMLDGLVNFNIQDVLRIACLMARSDISTGERNRFYDKYIKPMRLTVSEDGQVKIRLGLCTEAAKNTARMVFYTNLPTSGKLYGCLSDTGRLKICFLGS